MAQLATVAQLTGVDAGGLVSMIVQAVGTVRRNKKECRKLARRVGIVGDLLQRLQDPETMQDPVVRKPLSELEETLRHAYTLVSSCQNSSMVYRLFCGWKQADQLREVQESITFCLIVFPMVSYLVSKNRDSPAHPPCSAVRPITPSVQKYMTFLTFV